MDGNTIIGIVSAAAVGFIWWDIRSIRKDNKATQDENKKAVQKLVDACHICQVSLPDKYASRESVDRLWTRTDKHADDISWLKGVKNGSH